MECMTQKKKRIKISSLKDFKDEIKKEGFEINKSNEEDFKKEFGKIFNIDSSLIENIYTWIEGKNITYKVNDINDLIDYIEKIILFENEYNSLWEKLSKIEKLNIDRIEYEREPCFQEDVDNILNIIEKLSNEISSEIDEKDKIKLINLENEIDKEYLYAKDIELLKKILINSNENAKEVYNEDTKIKTVSIKIPKKINHSYSKAEKGSVLYHEYLSNNAPRIQRLIRNISKYIKVHENENSFNIHQSEALQDSINIALAVYDKKEFKAISGSNEIHDYCKAPLKENAAFKSRKVNKLGKLGIGYDRVNDSEKKILEEIHRLIENKSLNDKGNLILYSKLKPCPSCYLVINQFRKKHPNINVQVKYYKEYGSSKYMK